MKITKDKRLFISLLVLVFICVDFFNFDRDLYLYLCNLISFVFSMSCTNFYDIPIWEAGVTFGTIAAAYYAYAGITESNKRLEVEQSPHLVFAGHIVLAGGLNGTQHRLHTVGLKNIGKGRALNITITADDKERISIVEGSNSHSIDLKEGDHNSGWAIDEHQVIRSLQANGIKIKNSVFDELPDENDLQGGEKANADFYLYLWYEDQIGNKYKTIGKFRRSGHFLKHMESKIIKI